MGLFGWVSWKTCSNADVIDYAAEYSRQANYGGYNSKEHTKKLHDAFMEAWERDLFKELSREPGSDSLLYQASIYFSRNIDNLPLHHPRLTDNDYNRKYILNDKVQSMKNALQDAGLYDTFLNEISKSEQEKLGNCCLKHDPSFQKINSLTTSEPTTSEPTTRELTTRELTTRELTTSELTTRELTTSELTTSELTTSELTTSEPTTSEPTTSKPTTSKPTTTPVPAIPGCKDKTQYSTMNNEELLKQAKSLPDSHPEKLDLINEIVKRNLTKQAEGYGFQIHDLGQAPVNQTTIIDWMKNRAHSLVNDVSPLITHGMHYLTAITTSGAVCVTAVLQNQTSQQLHGGSTAGPNPNLLAGIIAGTILGGSAIVGGAYCLYSKYQQNKNYQAVLQNEQGKNSEKAPLN